MIRMFRRVGLTFIFGVVTALAMVPAQAGAILDRIRDSGHLVIAYREASVPFSYIGPDGKPIGYAIDLCRHLVDAVATKLGKKSLTVDYLLVTSATRVGTIADGKADLECESTTNTAERRTKVAFTVPHYITGTRYVVRSDSPIEQLSDFRDRRLVSTAGTAPLKAVRAADREYGLGIHISEVPDHPRGVEMVAQGMVDGFAMDEVLLAGLITTQSDPGKFKIVGKYLTIEPLAMMLPRGDADYKRVLDDEMKRLIRSGEAAELHDRWFTKPIPPNNRTLALPIPYLLRDFWKYPSDWVPE